MKAALKAAAKGKFEFISGDCAEASVLSFMPADINSGQISTKMSLTEWK